MSDRVSDRVSDERLAKPWIQGDGEICHQGCAADAIELMADLRDCRAERDALRQAMSILYGRANQVRAMYAMRDTMPGALGRAVEKLGEAVAHVDAVLATAPDSEKEGA